MAGISSLFPDFPKQMSVMDRVKTIIQRHKNNYFKNWYRILTIPISTIPIAILTTILYTSQIYFKKNHNTGIILEQICIPVLCTILVYQYCDRQVQDQYLSHKRCEFDSLVLGLPCLLDRPLYMYFVSHES